MTTVLVSVDHAAFRSVTNDYWHDRFVMLTATCLRMEGGVSMHAFRRWTDKRDEAHTEWGRSLRTRHHYDRLHGRR